MQKGLGFWVLGFGFIGFRGAGVYEGFGFRGLDAKMGSEFGVWGLRV